VFAVGNLVTARPRVIVCREPALPDCVVKPISNPQSATPAPVVRDRPPLTTAADGEGHRCERTTRMLRTHLSKVGLLARSTSALYPARGQGVVPTALRCVD
jgi:hypothetical protein